MRAVWILAGMLICTPALAAKFLCVSPDGSTRKTSDPTGCQTLIGLPEEMGPNSSDQSTTASPRPAAPSARPTPAPVRKSNPERLANPACVKTASEVSRDIKTSLAKKYKGSYGLQETLYNSHMEAYRNICRMRVTPELVPTLERVYRRYYPSYSLMWTLVQNEKEAYRRLHR